jgi:hypothetical protein
MLRVFEPQTSCDSATINRLTAQDPTQLIRAALPEVAALMTQAFDAVGGTPVPESELDQLGLADGAAIVEDYLAVGESGLALDHLIYMVHEPDLPISTDTFEFIAEAGQMMNVDPALWERIRPGA